MSGAPSALRGTHRQGVHIRNDILMLSVVYSLSYEVLSESGPGYNPFVFPSARLRVKNFHALGESTIWIPGTELLYCKQGLLRRVFTRFEFKVAQLTTQNCKRRKAWT